MRCEQRNVFRSLAQGWQGDRERIKAIEKVLAEVAGMYQHGEILIGGAEDSDVGVTDCVRAQLLVLAGFDEAQYFRLSGQWEGIYLVEEEYAGICHLDQASAGVRGSCESASNVAEQTIFEEIEGRAGAVKRNERMAGTPAGAMDALRDEILSGTGFTVNENGKASSGVLPGLLELVLKHGALANDLRECIFGSARPSGGLFCFEAQFHGTWFGWLIGMCYSPQCRRRKRRFHSELTS